MINKMLPFIISFIAGLSTLFGIIPTYFNYKYRNIIIRFSLVFSGIIMIIISTFSLIPDAVMYLYVIDFISFIKLLIYINVGIIISIFINNCLDNNSNNKLYKIGLLSLIALILHNIPEGIITYITSYKNIKLGIKMSLMISLHNIPEGIAICIPIYYSTNNRFKAIFYTLLSGFSELLGTFISFLFFRNISNYILGIILSITAGIMIYISIFELIINNKKLEE